MIQLSLNREIVPNLSKGCPKIVRFSTRQHVRDDFDVRILLGSLGSTVLHVGQRYHNSLDLVIVEVPPLLKLPHTADRFILEDVNPTEPTDREKHKYGILRAKMVAEERFLQNALSAIFYTEVRGPASCYRSLAGKNGLIARLEAWTFYSDFVVTSSIC